MTVFVSVSNPWSVVCVVLGLAKQPPHGSGPTSQGSSRTVLSTLLLPLMVLLVDDDGAVPDQLPVHVPPDHLELEPGALLLFLVLVQTTSNLQWLLLQVDIKSGIVLAFVGPYLLMLLILFEIQSHITM